MEQSKYMWVPVKMLPDEVMEKYQLHNLVVNGRIFTDITCSMYRLPQYGWIAYDKLIKNLALFGCHPVKRMPVLWKHKKRPINFCLVVDDFGVKYVSHKNTEHLANSIKPDYNVPCD